METPDLTLKYQSVTFYNRLISYVDKMNFSDLNKIDRDIRALFLSQFNELNQRIMDHKKQIEMKYALELAQERARRSGRSER